MEAHPFMCPASRCTYGSTGHVSKAYVSDSNQFKIYIESEVRIFWVYGDVSATLYITSVQSLDPYKLLPRCILTPFVNFQSEMNVFDTVNIQILVLHYKRTLLTQLTYLTSKRTLPPSWKYIYIYIYIYIYGYYGFYLPFVLDVLI